MLPRDFEINLFVRKRFPKNDVGKFQDEMYNMTGNNLHIVALSDEEMKKSMEENNQLVYIQGGVTLTSFVVGVLLYNKLPYFKNVQSRWGRFFWKCFLFGVPSYFAMGYSMVKQGQNVDEQYRKLFDRYLVYKCTGNIRDLNPEAKLV